VPNERHRFDVWSFIFGAAFVLLAALVLWLPVEPGWAIILGRAMGPAILVLIGIGLLVSVWQRRRPDVPGEPLLAEPLGRTEDPVDDMDHAIAGSDVSLDDSGVADRHGLPIDTDR
jgi:hypothetical protein